MKAIAEAGKKRDISIFNKTIEEYNEELKTDEVVQNHLKTLYDNLLEQNLVRIIEPYSRVQIAHVAETISLPFEIVEKKLSQIILDKKFSGKQCIRQLIRQHKYAYQSKFRILLYRLDNIMTCPLKLLI